MKFGLTAESDAPPLTPFLPVGEYFSYRNAKAAVTSPLTVTLVFLFVSMYLNCVTQVYAQYRAVLIDARTLPDIGFDILPNIDPILADICCYGMMLLTLVRFFFGYLPEEKKRIRRDIFRRHIFCLGTLFLFRAVSIISTMLPNPLETCVTDVEHSPWYEALRILNGSTVTCADVMYSGHTVNITLCCMTWHAYSHVVPITTYDPLFSKFGRLTNKLGDLERFTTAKVLIWSLGIFGYICIIGSRFHYTLDVFIGLLLTIAVFKYHMFLIRTAHLKNTWYNRLIVWSEGGSADVESYKNLLSSVNTTYLEMRVGIV